MVINIFTIFFLMKKEVPTRKSIFLFVKNIQATLLKKYMHKNFELFLVIRVNCTSHILFELGPELNLDIVFRVFKLNYLLLCFPYV